MRSGILFKIGTVIIIISTLLVSCSQNTKIEDDESTTITESTTLPDETTALYPQYDMDLESRDFNIIYFDAPSASGWSLDIPCDINTTEINGEILNDAVYERNRKIESEYNLVFKTIVYNGSGVGAEKIRKAVASASNDYDLSFVISAGELSQLISGRCLADLSGLIDPSMPWYDENSLDSLKIGNKIYSIASDMNFMDELCVAALFFNKQIAADYNFGNIYSIVNNYEWTLENMTSMCKAVTSDVDGDGIINLNDKIGFFGAYDTSFSLYQGAGKKYCILNSDGIPEISCYNEEAINVFESVFAFMNDKTAFLNRQNGYDEIYTVPQIINMFNENRVFILQRPLQAFFDFRDMQSDFGVIPMPLMIEGQEQYSTPVYHSVSSYPSIPVSASDIEVSADILDVLSAESHYTVRPVFYDVILGSKLNRDEETVKNLDLLFGNIVFDPGYIYDFGSLVSSINLTGIKTPDKVVSTIEKNKDKVQGAIDSFIESINQSSN